MHLTRLSVGRLHKHTYLFRGPLSVSRWPSFREISASVFHTGCFCCCCEREPITHARFSQATRRVIYRSASVTHFIQHVACIYGLYIIRILRAHPFICLGRRTHAHMSPSTRETPQKPTTTTRPPLHQLTHSAKCPSISRICMA